MQRIQDFGDLLKRTGRKSNHLGKEEAELIARCIRGDIKSYELLYNRFSQAMYHTCIRVVIHEADAEDILQDSFMEAFMNLNKLKDTEAFGGWIKRIVLNKSINHIKRNQKKWFETEDIELENISGEDVFIESEFENKLGAITEAMNALPGKQRLIINLHVFEEMSFEEMAVLLVVPSSTLRSQYMRIKQKIVNRISHKM